MKLKVNPKTFNGHADHCVYDNIVLHCVYVCLCACVRVYECACICVCVCAYMFVRVCERVRVWCARNTISCLHIIFEVLPIHFC